MSSWGYSYQTKITNQPLIKQKSTERKQQNQSSPKLIENDQIYQLTNQDEEYLQYLIDRYLYGNQPKISQLGSWYNKDPKDFRKKIHNMITQFSRKNEKKQDQLTKESREKAMLFQDLLSTLFEEMNTKKFHQTKQILQSKNLQFISDLRYQKTKYIEQLTELQRNESKLMADLSDLYEHLCSYKKVIQSLDDHKKLVELVNQYQRTKVFDEQATQKLITLTANLGEYQTLLKKQNQKLLAKQSSPHKWLKHFLGIINQNFDQDKINQLQKSVDELSNDNESKAAMNTLTILCQRKGKQARFMEQLNKMTSQKYNSVKSTFQLILNTEDSNLKKKFQDAFVKQLAAQIIETQNENSCRKGESYTVKMCLKYLGKEGPQRFQIPQSQFFTKIESSKLLDIEQKLMYIQELLGSQQKKPDEKTSVSQTDPNALSEISASIQRISKFLIEQNRYLNQSPSSINSSQISQHSIPDRKNMSSKSIEKNIVQNNPIQIESFKRDIQVALKKLLHSATNWTESSPNKKKSLYYQIGADHFDQFITTLTQKVNKLQEMISSSLNQQSKTSKTFAKTGLNRTMIEKKSTENSSNISLISSLQEQLAKQKFFSDNNIKENMRLKLQISTFKQTIEKLQKQNSQLDKLNKQNLQLKQDLKHNQHLNQQWQRKWQKQNDQIKRLESQANQKEIEMIDLIQQMENNEKHKKRSQNQIKELKIQITQKQKQIETLKTQIQKLHLGIKQQNNQKETLTRISQKSKQSFILRITELQKVLKTKNEELIEISKTLNQKDILINKLKSDLTENLTQIQALSKKVKQLELQCQKSKTQKRVANFKSFNTNAKDSQARKNMVSIKKTQIPQKEPESKANPLKAAIDSKNLSDNLLKLNKIDQDNKNSPINRNQKLGLNYKVLHQSFIPMYKTDKNQTQGSSIFIKKGKQHNEIAIKSQQIILNDPSTSSKIKPSRSNTTSLIFNDKQPKIEQKNQVLILNKKLQGLQKQNQNFAAQVQESKKQIQRIEKSVSSMRQKNMNVLTELQQMKNEKQSIKVRLQQVTQQLANCKSSSQEKVDEIKKLQEILTIKNKENSLSEEKIKEISEQLNHQKNERATIVEQLKSLKKKNSSLSEQYPKQQNKNVTIFEQYQKLQMENTSLKTNLQKFKKELNDAKIQLQNRQKELQDTKTTLQSLQKEFNENKESDKKNEETNKPNSMSEQVKQKEENPTDSQAQIKEMKMKILTLELDLEQKTQHYNELRQKFKKETTTLKNKIQQLSSSTPEFQSEISNNKAEISSLKNEIQKKQQVLKQKEKQIVNLQKKIVELQQSFKRQKQDANMLQQQIKQLTKQNQSKERQLQRLHEQINKLESENESLNQKLRSERNANKEQTQKMKKDHQLQIKNLRLDNARQLQEIKKQIKSVEFAQKVKSTADTSSQSTALLKLQYEKLKRQFEASQKTRSTLQGQIKSLEEYVKQLKAQLNDKIKKLKQATTEVKFMKDSHDKLKRSLVPTQRVNEHLATIIYDRYFQNQALDQQPYKRYLLYDLIQQKTKKQIKKTRLVYTIDLLNKVNFHNYLDGNYNLLVVIKTTKGSIFGAFSTSKLERYFKQPAGTMSFIYTFDTENSIEHFNIDTKKPLNVKSFDWDEFFFIFGNAEIRWRFGEKRIHSSFGINNAYYETKGKDVSILLRQGNTREVPIDQLEFYQVEFEN